MARDRGKRDIRLRLSWNLRLSHPFVRDRWHNGARHGFFLDPDFCRKFWGPFLRDGAFVNASLAPEPPKIWLQVISVLKIKYVIMVTISMLIFFLGHYAYNLEYPLPPIPPDVVTIDVSTAKPQNSEMRLAPVPPPIFVSISLNGHFSLVGREIHGKLLTGSVTTEQDAPKIFPEKLTHIGISICYFKRGGTTDQFETFPPLDFYKWKDTTPVNVELAPRQNGRLAYALILYCCPNRDRYQPGMVVRMAIFRPKWCLSGPLDVNTWPDKSEMITSPAPQCVPSPPASVAPAPLGGAVEGPERRSLYTRPLRR